MDNNKLKTSIERIEQISDTTPISPRDYEDIVDSTKAATSLTTSIERIKQISGETGPRPTFVDCEDIVDSIKEEEDTNVSLFCPECNAPIDYNALVTTTKLEMKLEEKRLKMARDSESSSTTEQSTHDEEDPVPEVRRSSYSLAFTASFSSPSINSVTLISLSDIMPALKACSILCLHVGQSSWSL